MDYKKAAIELNEFSAFVKQELILNSYEREQYLDYKKHVTNVLGETSIKEIIDLYTYTKDYGSIFNFNVFAAAKRIKEVMSQFGLKVN